MVAAYTVENGPSASVRRSRKGPSSNPATCWGCGAEPFDASVSGWGSCINSRGIELRTGPWGRYPRSRAKPRALMFIRFAPYPRGPASARPTAWGSRVAIRPDPSGTRGAPARADARVASRQVAPPADRRGGVASPPARRVTRRPHEAFPTADTSKAAERMGSDGAGLLLPVPLGEKGIIQRGILRPFVPRRGDADRAGIR